MIYLKNMIRTNNNKMIKKLMIFSKMMIIYNYAKKFIHKMNKKIFNNILNQKIQPIILNNQILKVKIFYIII